MDSLKVALVGAGSRCFGPSSVRDVLLSDVLCECNLELALMDINPGAVEIVADYARCVAEKLGRNVKISSTTSLEAALVGACFVVDAVEIDRDMYWAMDYHIPRRYGFKQIYGENGGPGSHFHALRNMRPIVEIAQQMEESCPDALLINYTNPMHKLCQAATTLSQTKTVGLCHGVYMGLDQLAFMLGLPQSDFQAPACGINHFTWFQSVTLKSTGEDLYPRLRELDKTADWFAEWNEIALSRVLFRRFGLYPSPGTNHIGEYIGWADEFYANEIHWFYDPADGHPWTSAETPEFVYSMAHFPLNRPFVPRVKHEQAFDQANIKSSGEDAAPIMEAMVLNRKLELPAVNVVNNGAIPALPDELIVEVPATVDRAGVQPQTVPPLPEPVAALIRTQASIQKLLVEAFAEKSKAKLLQAQLLEPTVNSYRGAAEMVDEMLLLQRDLLPSLS